MDEKGQLRPEVAKKCALVGGVAGAVIWAVFGVLAGIMLVSLGLWPIVVWPFVFYWYAGHLGKAVTAYQRVVKPQKWEQNVVVNVSAELTEEQISKAATRAVNERAEWWSTQP